MLSRHTRPATTADTELKPRQVKFDWSTAPFQWIPGDAFGSHAINHFSFTLVRGELFFCRVFNQALPHVKDAALRKDVEVFIRQEGIHSRAHRDSIDQYLTRYKVDLDSNYRREMWVFEQMLADQPFGIKIPKLLQKQWLTFRVGIVAAAEHYTCGFGQYVLDHCDWEARGANHEVSDLFTWHSAEEVEHRTVAYDLYRHLGGTYSMRALIMLVLAPTFLYLMAAGTAELANSDDEAPEYLKSIYKTAFWRAWLRSTALNNIMSPGWFMTKPINFMLPGYNPVNEGNTAQAQAYISRSPGVIANGLAR
ncbi:MAG: metal-dependent hydrolase [Pedobacter sp.]|nr:metal-dependent hydrolase [Pedobacter sp.]